MLKKKLSTINRPVTFEKRFLTLEVLSFSIKPCQKLPKKIEKIVAMSKRFIEKTAKNAADILISIDSYTSHKCQI